MLALAAVATVAGLVATVQLRGTATPPYDAWYHLDLARQWRTGDGLTTSAEISAGYPLFVAGVDLLRHLVPGSPDLGLALGVVQSLALGVNVVLAARLGRGVAGPATGLGSAALLAVWPNLALSAPLALAEPVTITCALGVAVLLLARGRPSVGRVAAAGALIGLGAQLRPGLLPLVVLLLAVPSTNGWGERWRTLLLGGTLTVLVLLPFAARSSYVAHTLVLTDLRGGVNLCLGRAPGADHPPVDRGECPVPAGSTAAEADRIRLRQAWRELRADPLREPGLVLVRGRVTLWDADRSSLDELARLQGPHLGHDTADRLSGFSTWLSRLVLVLATVGTAAAAWRRDGPVLRVALTALLLLVPTLVALGDARYRLPVVPFLAVLAAYALTPPRTAAGGGDGEAAGPEWGEVPAGATGPA